MGLMRERMARWALVLLVVVFFAPTIRYAGEAVRLLAAPDRIPDAPRLNAITQRFFAGNRAVEAAGISPEDILRKAGDQEVRGAGDWYRVCRGYAPGDPVRVELERPDGSRYTTAIALKAFSDSKATWVNWVMRMGVHVLLPFTCLLLAFLVAWRRPDQRLAWLLFGLLVSMSQFARSARTMTIWTWPVEWRALALFLDDGLGDLFFPFLVWFGLAFSRPRSAIWRWLGLALTIIATAWGLAVGVASLASAVRADWAEWIYRGIPQWWNLRQMISVGLVVFFLIHVTLQWRREMNPAPKRNLRLLMAATWIGLMPTTILIAMAAFRGRDIDAFPEFLWIPALLLLPGFPFALAYLVLVERAVDVGVLVRQGLQYALAQRTISVLRAVVLAGASIWVADRVRAGGLGNIGELSLLALVVVAVALAGRGADRVKRMVDQRFFREQASAERVLSEMGDTLRSMVEPAEIVKTVTSRVSDALHVESSWWWVAPDAAEDGEAAVLREALDLVEPTRIAGNGVEVVVPLRVKGELEGVIALGPRRAEVPYSRGDLELLRAVAGQATLALENAQLAGIVASEAAARERLHRELEIARDVQRRLLPQRLPEIPGLQIAAICRPAQSVGGDAYDFVVGGDGALYFTVGDVSGKGVPAALLMSHLQATLRGLLEGGVAEVGTLMTKLNRLVYDATPANRFATLFLGVYRAETGELIYASAGHPASLLGRRGEVIALTARGPGLGLSRKASYQAQAVQMAIGDTLLVYSDGVTEAMNETREEFGEERTARVFSRLAGDCGAGVLNGVLGEVDEFVAGAPQNDDITIVVVKACGGNSSR